MALGIWLHNWEAGCSVEGAQGRFEVLSAEERGAKHTRPLPKYYISWRGTAPPAGVGIDCKTVSDETEQSVFACPPAHSKSSRPGYRGGDGECHRGRPHRQDVQRLWRDIENVARGGEELIAVLECTGWIFTQGRCCPGTRRGPKYQVNEQMSCLWTEVHPAGKPINNGRGAGGQIQFTL